MSGVEREVDDVGREPVDHRGGLGARRRRRTGEKVTPLPALVAAKAVISAA